MFDAPPITKLLIVVLVISFGGIAFMLYLPQMNTVSNTLLESNGIMFGLGLMGVGMILISGVYFIECFYNHDYQSGFTWSFLLIIIGLAFVIAWLY